MHRHFSRIIENEASPLKLVVVVVVAFSSFPQRLGDIHGRGGKSRGEERH